MEVARLDPAPRPTLPFPAGDGGRLELLGAQIDRRLAATGETLTIGGEPTFVAESDRDAPEWNGEALGPTKKTRALDLLRRLAGLWAPGAVLHSAQGKWYPGEPLPRWSLACFWRPDGVPVWKDPALRADETVPGRLTHADARRFLEALTGVLGVPSRYILEAFEDPLHFLTLERNLPLNVVPGDPRLASAEERRRLIDAFSHGLHNPTGFVLPLQKGSWKSGPWPVRGGKLVLIPGDSPVGLRLPLDRLPWANEVDRTVVTERDPFEGAPPRRSAHVVPPYRPAPAAVAAPQKVNPMPVPEEHPPLAEGESAAWVVRTALCAQVRGGNLYLFLPPVRQAEDWFALVAEIERTAAQLAMPVILEGYTPPYGEAFASFQITPDPGVIEVNLPPAADSATWSRRLTQLWDQAALAGLSTVKYLVGGQETGSGGGCHWVLGGPTPAASPFLRRPDLLRSWLLTLNRHPSLSYAFAGLFVGPSSQAPRVDEAQPTSLEDLELAFAELDRGGPTPPWLADRIFRHLLVDGTGNTHRTELCIDKLFSPDRASGRLGLVEFRSFEMAPHRDLALATSQLLRALTLSFLERPVTGGLVRWGPALRDRWMLPAALEEDLEAVLSDLDRVGLVFPREPFQALTAFRFPVIGTLTYEGIEVEVRQALEPWPVLGEEGGPGGTVRYVDSSVERVQVRARGLDPGRYALASGGFLLPLRPAADGSLVSGLRFKAWRLASGLHPTLEPRPQLVVDLVDLNARRVVAGCTLGHPPGGAQHRHPPGQRLRGGGPAPGPLRGGRGPDRTAGGPARPCAGGRFPPHFEHPWTSSSAGKSSTPLSTFPPPT